MQYMSHFVAFSSSERNEIKKKKLKKTEYKTKMCEVSLKQGDFRGKVFVVTVKQLIIVEHMVVLSRTILCIRNLR